MLFEKIKWIEYSAEHTSFYKSMEMWKRSIKNGKLPENCVYVLSTGMSIPRIFDNDKHGILYIGRGKTEQRLGKLINGVNHKEYTHPAGKRFQDLNYKQRFPFKTLKISIFTTESNSQIEADLLNDYLMKFGELPPLNRAGSNEDDQS